MAAATVTGSVRNFSRVALINPRMWIHPVGGPGRANPNLVLSDRPISVTVGSNGEFSVSLEDLNTYQIEVQAFDNGHNRVAQSIWSKPFPVPVGGGPIGELIGLPVNSGRVRVLQSPPDENIFDQYSYDETTGDLYERTS